MKKKKASLERRIFILFFMITFILTLIILGIAWLIVNYQINRLFVLIELSAATLFAVIIIGLWFSKTIMQPINKVSEKFQEISKNPSKFEPILEKYGGRLGDVIETFNEMNRDLAEYSRAQQEYKVIIDNLDTGIFWMDAEFKIILCNPSFVSIFELTDYKEAIGRNISDFIKFKDIFQKKAKEDSITIPVLELDLHNQKKYGILNIRSVKNETGLRLVGSITDITKEVKDRKAREALELELIKSNKLAEIGRRVEGVVHNINSPLNSILGYAQLIKKDLVDNEDVDKILEAGKIISHSVKLLLRKVKRDNISMMVPININELIKQELELCKHNLFFKHYVMLETSLFKDLPEVKLVYSDISQCFVNIINNAIESLTNSIEKYILVRTYQTNNMIAIEVQDTGEGIKNKDIENIFKPYYTTKSQKDGSGFGLGLAISKSVADRYGGYITVRSKVHEGSTFTLFIPINE